MEKIKFAVCSLICLILLTGVTYATEKPVVEVIYESFSQEVELSKVNILLSESIQVFGKISLL